LPQRIILKALDQPVSNISDTITIWVDQYCDHLYTWAFHKVSDKETAEDLVQETFLSAVKSFDTYEGKSNPKTWLLSILNNKIIDHYRKSASAFVRIDTAETRRGMHITDSFFDNDDGWKVPVKEPIWDDADGHLLDNKGFNEVLGSCMGNLPGNWKMALTAKYIIGKDSGKICQELNITPSNYWQILHRAKLLLKKCLETNWFNL
jgi:RNA polymerase sigma-70 factor (TIGR02943 family)